MANEETADVIEQPKSKKGLIIAIVAVVNLALVGGLFVVLSGGKSDDDGAPAKQQNRGRQQRAASPTGPIVDLPGFVVNLNTSRDKQYLKTKLSVQLFTPEDQPEFDKYGAQVKNEILLQLSVVDLEKVQTIDGKRALEKLLVEKINSRLDMDRVGAVYFTEFVTQ